MFVMALQFLLLLVMLATDVAAGSATFYYSDGPWKGTVVDAETKQPIEGVVVLAVWEKFYRTPAGRNAYFYDATEVLTNKNGEFVIPNFSAVNFNPLAGIEGPRFMIYKPEFTPFPGAGQSYFITYFPFSPLRVDDDALSEILKRAPVIELLHLRTNEERIKAQSEAQPLGDVPHDKMPVLIKFINAERNRLGLKSIPLESRR